jgi:hypothetical protein
MNKKSFKSFIDDENSSKTYRDHWEHHHSKADHHEGMAMFFGGTNDEAKQAHIEAYNAHINLANKYLRLSNDDKLTKHPKSAESKKADDLSSAVELLS